MGTYRLLEDAFVAPVLVRSVAHLVLGRVRVDDAVLAGDLLAVALLVLLLFAHVPLQLVLELLVDRLQLALLDGEGVVLRALRVRLERAEGVANPRVGQLRVLDQVVELALRRRVGARQRPLVQRRDRLHGRRQGTDLGAHVRHATQEVLLRHDAGGGCAGMLLAVGALLLLLAIVVLGVVLELVVILLEVSRSVNWPPEVRRSVGLCPDAVRMRGNIVLACLTCP